MVVAEGRQPFMPDKSPGELLAAELRAQGNEVDYVWLPQGTTTAEQKDAALAAALLYLEGTERVITIGFPASYIQHLDKINVDISDLDPAKLSSIAAELSA